MYKRQGQLWCVGCVWRLLFRSSTESESEMNNVLFATVVLLSFFCISMQSPCSLDSYTHEGQLHNPGIAGHPNFRVVCNMDVSVCYGGCHTEHQYKVHKYSGGSHGAMSYCHINVKCCTALTVVRKTPLYNCVPHSGYTGTPPSHSSTYYVYIQQATDCECQNCIQSSTVAHCNALHA